MSLKFGVIRKFVICNLENCCKSKSFENAIRTPYFWNVLLTFFNWRIFYDFREELRGIKRGPNAQDVDWSKVAGSVSTTQLAKPVAIKIPVSDVLTRLNKVKPTASNAIIPIQDLNCKYWLNIESF